VVVEKVTENPNITVMTSTSPVEFRGDSKLQSVVLKNAETGETTELTPGGVFVFIGLSPNTKLVQGLVELDGAGFIATGPDLQTSTPGLFAAGDVRAGSTKQAASAAGEGAAVALGMRHYLEPFAGMRPAAADTVMVDAMPSRES
jgi:thioredoxin reductase (NADPH)